MPFDAPLAETMRATLASRTGLVEKKMFGGLCWMVQGHMLCGIEGARFMFRVGPEREAQALALPGATPMDFTGRPMRGFVWVDGAQAVQTGLARWVDLAAGHVDALPPKGSPGASPDQPRATAKRASKAPALASAAARKR